LSSELAPRSSRVGRAWVRSASRRLWMCPLGCLSAPSDLCSHLREPLLCSAFVSRVCVCHRSEPNAWTMACPCGPSCACFSAFRCQRSGSRVSQSGLRAAEGCSLSGAAVRYDRFYHLRRPSCQHLNRGNLLSCVVPASRLPVTLTATVKGYPRADTRIQCNCQIAPQSDLTLSTGLAGTPVIAAMLSGLVPHDLVLRCHPRSCPLLFLLIIALPRVDTQAGRDPRVNSTDCRTTILPSSFGSGRAERRGTPCTLGETDPESEYSVLVGTGETGTALSEAVHSETKKSSPGVMRAGRHSLYT